MHFGAFGSGSTIFAFRSFAIRRFTIVREDSESFAMVFTVSRGAPPVDETAVVFEETTPLAQIVISKYPGRKPIDDTLYSAIFGGNEVAWADAENEDTKNARVERARTAIDFILNLLFRAKFESWIEKTLTVATVISVLGQWVWSFIEEVDAREEIAHQESRELR